MSAEHDSRSLCVAPSDLATVGCRAPLRVAIILPSAEVPFWIARLVEDILRSRNIDLCAVLIAPVKVRKLGLLRACTFPAELKPDYRQQARLEDIRAKLAQVTLVELAAGERCKLEPQQVAAILSFGLDILLNLALPTLEGEILHTARYGVWEFTSRGLPVQSQAHVGFWEAYRREPLTRAALRASTADGRKRLLIETEVRTRPDSLAMTRAVLESAITLFRYATERLARNRSSDSDVACGSIDEVHDELGEPSIPQILSYAARSCAEFAAVQLRMGMQRMHWAIGVSHVPPLSLTSEHLAQLNWLTPSRSRFWADPFVIESKGRKYVFVEDCRHRTGKGEIWFIELMPDGSTSEARLALRTNYHLSFPFVFDHDGRMYMLPEQAQSGQVLLYEATSFPDQWHPRSVLLDDFAGVDSVVFQRQGRWWMFTTLDDHNNFENNLHLFHSDSLFGPFMPHPCNPVKISLQGSRMAGNVFREGKRLIRPAQNCTLRYGGSVVFYEVLKLDESSYEERLIGEVRPSSRSRYGVGLHTVNNAGDVTVVDGYRLIPSLGEL